jgi:PhzF family phenazine biosynthesis protein
MHVDLIDVFGARPLSGNPLAVVRGGGDLSPEAMLALTRWIGFSETTFLLSPSDPAADYRVRIFYPGGELPFAGHPTLGTCHAWLTAGGQPKRERIVQECGVGLVEIRRDHDRLAFRAPPFSRTGPLDEAELAEAIRVAGVTRETVVEAVHIANGPAWQLLRLHSALDVLAAQPASHAACGADVGLAGPSGDGWELRAFFANQRGEVVEDPVTGSFNAGVAVHLFEQGLVGAAYTAFQGRKVGADGRIYCSQDAEGGVWIGGRVDTIAAGASLALA